MKTTYRTKAFALFLLIFCGVVIGAGAQSTKKSRLRMYYEKMADSNKKISVLLTKGKGLNMRGVDNVDVELLVLNGEEMMSLTTIITDEDGKADLIIEDGYELPKNEKGFTTVLGYFKGNDSIKSSDNDVKFKELQMEVSLNIIDSAKFITASAYEDSVGNKIPVEGVDIMFGVERLHSILYLDELETDEEGIAEMEFPDDIPGNNEGNIKIVVKIDDHKHFGTNTKLILSDWGVPVDYTVAESPSLYGEEAPLWMTFSIFFILGGAWLYFLYAIYNVYKMRKTDTKIMID